jgi:serine/threonine-protein kinase
LAKDDYLVMDYVPGDDLRTLVSKAVAEKRFLDEEDVLDWARQIGDALDYLHNQQPPIVHRDIKPSNLKLHPHRAGQAGGLRLGQSCWRRVK